MLLGAIVGAEVGTGVGGLEGFLVKFSPSGLVRSSRVVFWRSPWEEVDFGFLRIGARGGRLGFLFSFSLSLSLSGVLGFFDRVGLFI